MLENGEVQLYKGDCMEMLDNIADNSVDCIVTSPPYNKKYFAKNVATERSAWQKGNIDYSEYSDDMPIEEYEEWQISLINKCLAKLKPHGSFFYNHKPIRHDNEVYFPINYIFRSNAKIYQEIIWDRNNSPVINNDILLPTTERIYWLCNDKPNVYRSQIRREYVSEIWNISPKPVSNHPAPFPLELPNNCILLTTQPDDIVLDPFMGTGTTGEASVRLGRKFIGIELAQDYFDFAKERINDTLSKTSFMRELL